jgi:hypothetical protein
MHANDADLQAWRDSELDADRSRKIAGHVDQCAACRRRAADVTRASRRTGELLALLDRAGPIEPRALPIVAARVERSARRRRSTLIAAAIALLGATGVAAAVPASPLHRLLAGLVSSPAAPALRPHRAIVPPAALPDSPAARHGGISFVPASELVVQLSPRPRTGVVSITIGTTDELTAVGRGGQLSFRISRDTLTLSANPPAERYELVVPARLRRFRLVAGSEVLLDRRPPAVSPDTATYRFDLGSR